jgi:hypothetical protein
VAVKIWVSVTILVSISAFLTYILRTKDPIFQGVEGRKGVFGSVRCGTRGAGGETDW